MSRRWSCFYCCLLMNRCFEEVNCGDLAKLCVKSLIQLVLVYGSLSNWKCITSITEPNQCQLGQT